MILVLATIAVAAISATANLVHRDGYRRIPTRFS